MTEQELDCMAEDLVEELREMPDGTETSAVRLIELGGYDPGEFDDSDIIAFHRALRRAARANHINLEILTKKRGDVGMILPSDLVYAVHNDRAQIKCPRCGSRNTARILYGMPAYSSELQEKLDSGKVFLGGCGISAVRDGNGGMIPTDPARYCNACHKEFGVPPYRISKDRSTAEAYADIVTGIRFIYSEFCPKLVIEIRKNPEGADVSVLQFPYAEDSVPARQISPLRWKRLVNRLYTKLYVHEWKKNYQEDAPDGFHWSLTVMMTGRRVRTVRGSNAYPPYWEELKTLFRPFARL